MEARICLFSDGIDSKISYVLAVLDAEFIMKDGKSIGLVGVTPDEIVLPTGQDLAARPDPVLARAAQFEGLDLTPAKAHKLFPFEWLPDGGCSERSDNFSGARERGDLSQLGV